MRNGSSVSHFSNCQPRQRSPNVRRHSFQRHHKPPIGDRRGRRGDSWRQRSCLPGGQRARSLRRVWFPALSSVFRPADSFFSSHGHRPSNWTVYDYFGEFGVVVQAIDNDAKIPTRGNLVAPSIQGTWDLEEVFQTGFLTSYDTDLSIISVEVCVLEPTSMEVPYSLHCILGIPTTTVLPLSPTPVSATL